MNYSYSDKAVTPWGGMLQMKRLIDKSGIREKLFELKLPEGKSNNSIDSVSIVESFWVSVWIGCFRFSHTAVVRLDEALKKIFGWKRVASGVTFTRFFQKFNWEENTRIFVSLNQWFYQQLVFDNYTLDVDSSVMTREQQGAKVGYNRQAATKLITCTHFKLPLHPQYSASPCAYCLSSTTIQSEQNGLRTTHKG